jgi:predicted component of type VI protein secretion system
MGKLVHFRADGTAIEIKLDRQRIMIGRRPDNDVCLAYPAVSGEHAAVVTILADSFLEDLGSTNGTRVNGTAITKHFLRDRDEIDVGQRVLVYLADDATTLEAPPQSVARPDAPHQRGRADAGTPLTAAGSGGVPGGVPSAQRAKRRSDGLAPAPGPSTDPVERLVTAEIDVGPVDAPATVPDADNVVAPSPPPDQSVEPAPALKVVSGAKAGRIVALVKDETLIGRAGVQVAALRRSADEVRVVPIEGTSPPCVNGTPVAREGQPLAVGDILEVAGTRLEVVAPSRRPSA